MDINSIVTMCNLLMLKIRSNLFQIKMHIARKKEQKNFLNGNMIKKINVSRINEKTRQQKNGPFYVSKHFHDL